MFGGSPDANAMHSAIPASRGQDRELALSYPIQVLVRLREAVSLQYSSRQLITAPHHTPLEHRRSKKLSLARNQGWVSSISVLTFGCYFSLEPWKCIVHLDLLNFWRFVTRFSDMDACLQGGTSLCLVESPRCPDPFGRSMDVCCAMVGDGVLRILAWDVTISRKLTYQEQLDQLEIWMQIPVQWS